MELALIEGIATSLDGNSILPIDNDLLLFSHRILMCYLEQEWFSRAWAGDSISKKPPAFLIGKQVALSIWVPVALQQLLNPSFNRVLSIGTQS